MEELRTILIGIVALVGLAGAAEASTDLWTMPIEVTSGDGIGCNIVNISSKTISVHVAIVNFVGGITQESTFDLFPHGGQGLVRAAQAGLHACQFTVTSKSKVRAGMALFTDSGNQPDKLLVPAQ